MILGTNVVNNCVINVRNYEELSTKLNFTTLRT